MNEPTNDELNRWAHAYLGRCLHEFAIDLNDNRKYCVKCPVEDSWLNPAPPIPDYCSDRNAAAELVEAVVKEVGHGHYADVLERASLDSPYIVTCDEELWGRLALAPARTLVLAAMTAAGGVE